jgi:hypothetical protein
MRQHYKQAERAAHPQLSLEFVDWIGINDRNAGFERNDQFVRHVPADRRVEREKKPTSLAGDRIAAINANVIAGVEGDKSGRPTFNVGAICGSLILRLFGSPATVIAYLTTGKKYMSVPIFRKE